MVNLFALRKRSQMCCLWLPLVHVCTRFTKFSLSPTQYIQLSVLLITDFLSFSCLSCEKKLFSLLFSTFFCSSIRTSISLVSCTIINTREDIKVSATAKNSGWYKTGLVLVSKRIILQEEIVFCCNFSFKVLHWNKTFIY